MSSPVACISLLLLFLLYHFRLSTSVLRVRFFDFALSNDKHAIERFFLFPRFSNEQEEYGPFEEDDVIRLVPDDEEIKHLRSLMEARRAKAKDKKEKKRKRHDDGLEAKDPAPGKKESCTANHGNGSKSVPAPNLALKGAALPNATSLANEARKNAKEGMKNNVFKSLFSDDDKKKDAKSLFISTGASRYTL